MSLADLPQVQLLAKQLGYPSSVEAVENRFVEMADNPDYALFVAKTDEDKVVGWGQVNKGRNSLLVADNAEVAVLVVDEQCRGQGIGKLLLQEIENWAKQNRFKRMSLLSNAKRTDAHRFYNREGYQVSKLSNVFTKSCE